MTSMAISDDVLSGESYFMTEIKSLKRITEAIQQPGITLCFIDEILRGTSTKERIAASQAVLHWISKFSCLCMAATHDQELTDRVGYQNVHFSEQMENGKITFDYRLKFGPSDTQNAILLLAEMGFAKEIVDEAKRIMGK